MARPSFLFITVVYDESTELYHAKLPIADPFAANGAVGSTREEAVKNLYLVMADIIMLCEEHEDDTVTVWVRPDPGGPTVKIVSL